MGYEYEVGLIRAKEEALLKRIDWERLLDMTSAREVWHELRRMNLPYKDIGSDYTVKHIKEGFLDNKLLLYKDIPKLLNDQALKNSFVFELYVYNLKLMYKEKALGLDLKDDYINEYLFDVFDFCFENQIFDKVSDIFKSETADISTKDFDFLVDNILYSYRVSVAQELNNEFLLGFWKREIDFINLRIWTENKLLKNDDKEPKFINNGNIPEYEWKACISDPQLEKILEIKEYLGFYDAAADMLKEDSKGNWDLVEEEFMLKYISDNVMYSVTVEPVVAYFYRKMCEIKNINRVLYAKSFGMDRSYIQESLSKSSIG